MKIEISDLIGVPFVEFGRNPKTGLDCYGLVIEIERRYGKKLNDVVSEKFDSEKLQRTLPKINVRKTEKIEEGSILEFYGKRDNRLHVAVSLGGNIFIQSTENQGVRISSLESAGQYLTLKNIYEVI